MSEAVEARGAGEAEKPPYGVLVAMICGTMLCGICQTAMNTMLPAVMPEMGTSVATGQWLVTIFQLCLGITMPTVAFLSKRYSLRALCVAAMLCFAAGVALVGLGGSFWVLFVGRAVEGVATGILMPLVQVVVFTRFPPQRWGTIMGFVGLTFGVAPNLGPTIGGAVTAVWGWRAFFLGALALSLVAMAAMAKLLAGGRAGDRAVTMDAPSLLLSILGFGGLLLGVSNAASAGFASAACLAPIAVGAVFVVAFVRREKRVENPMLNMGVFRDRDFSLGTVMVSLLFCAFIGVALVLPLELQSLHGFDAMQAGMALLPGTVAAFIMAPVGGMLTDRVGARAVCAMGSILLTVGTVLMLHLSAIDSLGQVMALQAVRAFGISSLIVPYTTWSVHGLPHEVVADGTSISNAARQIAAAIGTSSMVLLMAGGATDGSVTAAGVDEAMMFSLALTVAMTVLTFVFVKK